MAAEQQPEFQFMTWDLIGRAPEQSGLPVEVEDGGSAAAGGMSDYFYYVTGSVCAAFAMVAFAFGVTRFRAAKETKTSKVVA